MANKKLSATITIGGAITGALKNALGSTRDGLNSIGKAATDLKSRQRELNRIISEQGKLAGPGSALRIQYANQELGVINKQIDALRRKQQVIEQTNQLKSTGRDLMASGGLQLGAAVAAAAPLGMVVNAAADFQYQLQMIGNTANMTKQEISLLEQAIMTASERSGQSAATMQRAIGFLVAAGLDVNTSKDLLVQLGRTATATGSDIEDLAKAAFVLNDTLKIKPGTEMAAAMDTLAQAGKEGNVELKDMAKQLPVLGAGFAALKMGGREAAATMAAALQVARKGAADADEAANNMKNFIAKVMSPETLKKAEKSFGIDLYKIIQDAQSQGANPFEASMRAIIKATQGDQKKIGELFGDMQVQNFLRPMIQNWEDYERIKNKALSASDVIDKDYDAIMETTRQQMTELANAGERAVKTIGSMMAPAFGQLLGVLTPVVNSIVKFAKENPELTKTVLTGAAVVIGFTAALGAAKLATGAIVYALGPLLTVTKLVGLALPYVATGIRAITMAMAANPIGRLIVGLTTAAVLIYKNWEPIKGFFVGLWESVKSATGAAWEWMKNAFLNFTPLGLVIKNWEPIRGFFVGLFDGIRATVSSAIDWIIGKIQAVGEFWAKTKAFFGFGNDNQPKASAPNGSATAPPTLPAMRSTGAPGTTIHSNVTAPITINQQPGQNSKELADEVARRIAERQAVQRRGQMYDAALGY